MPTVVKHPLVFLLISVWPAFMLHAQNEANAEAETWDLSQCVERMYVENFQLKSFDFQIENREIELQQARNNFLPDIWGQARSNHNWGLFIDPSTNILTRGYNFGNNASIFSTLDIFKGFRNRHQLDLQRKRLQLSQQLRTAEGFAMVEGLLEDYFSLLQLQQQQNIVEQLLEQIDLEQSRMEKKVASGIVHERHLLEMDYLMSSLEEEALAINNQNELLKLAFLQQLGYQESRAFQLAADTSLEMEAMGDLTYLVDKAQKNHPELEQQQLASAVANQNIKVEQSYRYPDISLEGGLGTRTSNLLQESYVDQFEFNRYQYIAVALNVPIYRRNAINNRIAQAKIMLEANENQITITEMEVERRVNEYYRNVQNSTKKLEVNRKKRASIEALYEYERKRFEKGVTDFIRYNDILVAYLNAELDFLNAKYKLFKNQYLLAWYVGALEF